MNRTFFDGETNKMILNVYMLRVCVITAIFHQCDGGLVVAVEDCRMYEWSEYFTNELTEPKCFLCSMRGCDILGFGRGQCNELLFLQTPKYRPSVDEKSEASDCSTVFLSGTVRINISDESTSPGTTSANHLFWNSDHSHYSNITA